MKKLFLEMDSSSRSRVFGKGRANSRQQSLGFRCTPSMRSMLELRGSGASP